MRQFTKCEDKNKNGKALKEKKRVTISCSTVAKGMIPKRTKKDTIMGAYTKSKNDKGNKKKKD